MQKRRALFLDRDGVVNVDHGYIGSRERFEWRPGVFDLARAAAAAGMPIVVVTNQSGIARGLFDEDAYAALTEWMKQNFIEEGVPLTAVYHCPYHPQAHLERYRVDHPWRKPRPGMILAARDDLGLDLPGSILIGDQWTDIEAGRSAGVGLCALVEAEQGSARPDGISADVFLRDIEQAARWLKDHLGV